MRLEEVLSELRSHASPDAVRGMARYGISSKDTLGVSIPVLRGLSKRVGKDHKMALELWDTGLHEARILAAMVDVPELVTEGQMDKWVKDFDSWDVCDQCCGILFDKTEFAHLKAIEWSSQEKEYVRRAGYSMMAELAVHDKKAPDSSFEEFFPAIERGAVDERNFVKKAVNWALRQIGKRNRRLNGKALQLGRRLAKTESKSARWIASDAIKELESDSVQRKVRSSS
jgi:3-methyladenine DNA glycosylase AlkD